MSCCPSCGGIIGRDCWNPAECAEITAQMHYAASQPPAEDDGFDRVGEIARQAVREKIRAMLEPAEMLNSTDAQQAVILGALAGCVESFVCAAREDASRDRLKEALRDVVSDFVDQAKDQLVAGIQ